MTQREVDDASRFRRYLLGQMGEEERVPLEQRYMSDPAVHDELRAVERELIDEYVRGELRETQDFEKAFLSSPTRRQRISFARALVQASAAPSGAMRHEDPSGSSTSWLGRWRIPAPSWSWRLAAGAVLMLVAAALFLMSWRGEAPRTQALQAPQQLPQSALPNNTSPSAVEDRRPTASAPSGVSTPAVTANRGEQQPQGSITMATLILTPDLTRNADETRALVLGDQTDVRLQLHLEDASFDDYRVLIVTPESREVWRAERVRRERMASGDAVVVTLPANRLATEDYIVRVSGFTKDDRLEQVNSYYFRVRRP